MSKAPQLDIVGLSDPILSTDSLWPTSPLRSRSVLSCIDERQPLLAGSARTKPAKKPFYRARPLWLVPFAIIASLVRGMTLAPRVEVFTQLACGTLSTEFNHTTSIPSLNSSIHYASVAHDPYSSPYFAMDAAGPHHITYTQHHKPEKQEDDPRNLPSARCASDPAVQAGAAKIQTILTTTSGVLSALTTGWWGHFGERHGRTRVLAITTLGLFLTDLTFILVSTPHTPFSSHGHKLLIIAPFIEGLLGGWSTLQSATTAYVSDCTSDGSRAQIFSRYTGVFYIGLSLGPIIGAQLIKHPFNPFHNASAPVHPVQSVTCVFWVAIFCSFVNLILVTFVFPESLSKERRAKNALAAAERGVEIAGAEPGNAKKDGTGLGFLRAFFSPLGLFLPQVVEDAGGHLRKDWNLTYLAMAMFGYMLAMGIFQIKYLYAVHVYKWSAGHLSYYISLLGGIRAVHLLFILPFIITTFKPRPKTQPNTSGQPSQPAAKPKPTRALLAQEMHFDLFLTRLSFIFEIISQTSVTLIPNPNPAAQPTTYQQSIFVLASSLSPFSSGIVPAIQSLALCILQSRALAITNAGGVAPEVGPGKLLGALAVLQVTGQMIIGPVLFGVVYSKTVAKFPDAIFAMAAVLCTSAFAFVLMIRPDAGVKGKRRARARAMVVAEVEVERGRSRDSKDLRRSIPTRGIEVQTSRAGSASS